LKRLLVQLLTGTFIPLHGFVILAFFWDFLKPNNQTASSARIRPKRDIASGCRPGADSRGFGIARAVWPVSEAVGLSCGRARFWPKAASAGQKPRRLAESGVGWPKTTSAGQKRRRLAKNDVGWAKSAFLSDKAFSKIRTSPKGALAAAKTPGLLQSRRQPWRQSAVLPSTRANNLAFMTPKRKKTAKTAAAPNRPGQSLGP
jgi:hypothetical protein